MNRAIGVSIGSAVLFMLSIGEPLAQPTTKNFACELALIPDLEIVTASKQASFALLSLLNESSYKVLQHEGGASAKAIIKFVPVGADANYKDFSDARSTLFQQESFSAEEQQTLNILKKSVSSQAFDTYMKCQVESIHANTYGLHLVPVSVQQEYVLAHLTWRPAAPVTAAKLSGPPIVIGGVLKEPFAKDGVLLPNSEFTLAFTRNKGQSLSVAINLADGLGTQHFDIPAYENQIVTVSDQTVTINSKYQATTTEFAFSTPMFLADLRPDSIDVAHFHTLYELCMMPYNPTDPAKPLGTRWKISFRRQFIADNTDFQFTFKIKGTRFSDLSPEESPQRCP